ncbi:hypothetical protein SG34_016555 [Thalassomonas viridans]|uniref:Uncharacterized protein n=1 Tax=Thalassomonas viridans TaxID=137584 RepID=A0AAE9YXH9_9GAMM|nr:hypothetical protein [Thalassomonas viridans]WDE03041.1 hypothetical protein SG34_016555 [Thalassomonas viridans]
MMAKANDMPEFHSVKVFVTKNTPTRHRHNFINAGITSPHGFTDCSTTSCFIGRDVPLIFAGEQAHV